MRRYGFAILALDGRQAPGRKRETLAKHSRSDQLVGIKGLLYRVRLSF
jgi:hypothetical protein